MSHATGNGHGDRRDGRHEQEPVTPALDPAYDIPVVGRIIKEADGLRLRLPFGEEIATREAGLLRMEARALRLAANYLEARAQRLEGLAHPEESHRRPARRIPIE